MQTVESLRKDGWKVRVLHYRSDESCEGKIKSSHSKECKVSPKGGKTVVILDSPVGEHFEGLSICSPDDLYNKKIGVKIALGRALFSNSKDSDEEIHKKVESKGDLADLCNEALDLLGVRKNKNYGQRSS